MPETKAVIRLPDWIPQRGWEITKAKTRKRGVGYLRFKSRATRKGIPRGMRAHRWVVERLILADLASLDDSDLGRHRRKILEAMLLDGKLHPDIVVHHCNFNKLDAMPTNLVAMCSQMNPSGPCRHPYTGARISMAEYRSLMPPSPAEVSRDNRVASVTDTRMEGYRQAPQSTA